MINQMAQQDLLRSSLNPGREVPAFRQKTIPCMDRNGGISCKPETKGPRRDGSGVGEEAMGQRILAQPVRGLQHMLRRLSGYYRFLPEVEVDGVFGEKTMEAVMLFQRELNPPVTGVVDWATWNAIRDRYMELEAQQAAPRGLRAFPGEGCWVEPGADREFMILPQTMFQVLSRYFNGISPHGADGIHGTLSSYNVRWLQWAAGMEETGIMNAVTWEVLSSLYEIFVVKEEQGNRAKFIDGWG